MTADREAPIIAVVETMRHGARPGEAFDSRRPSAGSKRPAPSVLLTKQRTSGPFTAATTTLTLASMTAVQVNLASSNCRRPLQPLHSQHNQQLPQGRGRSQQLLMMCHLRSTLRLLIVHQESPALFQMLCTRPYYIGKKTIVLTSLCPWTTGALLSLELR